MTVDKIKEAEKLILLQEIEAHVKTRREREELAAALKDAHEVLEEVARPPYADSDPVSLLHTLKVRALRAMHHGREATDILSARDAAEQVKGAVKGIREAYRRMIEWGDEPRHVQRLAADIESGAVTLPPDAPGESEGEAYKERKR